MIKLTEEQLIKEVESGLKAGAIAKKYGMNARSLQRRIVRLSKKGYGHGNDKVVSKYVAPGFGAKRISTMVDAEGNEKIRWVITEQDKEAQFEAMRAAIEALTADIKPVTVGGSHRPYASPNLVNLYTISDFHLGMLANAEESGEDWDVKIAEQMFIDWFNAACESSPSAQTGVISLLGDLLHTDSLAPMTPASGHVLDADSRYFKMIEVAMRMVRRAVEIAATHHPKVHIVISQGNHDETGMLWLTAALDAMYDDEPRIVVDTSPDVYKMYRHGKTALFFHHGHKARFDAIESVMISRFRKDFGETEYAYAHVGHLHHQKVVESRNMVVEQHRTLSAKDAYAARGGWFSGRSANVITYHKEFGEVSRLSISPEMLK